jgi:hypothetical protein
MHDDGNPQSFPGPPGELRPAGGSCGRKGGTGDVGERDARLLEHRSFEEDAGETAAALGPVPRVAMKPAARVLVLERRTDALLQLEEEDAGGFDFACQIESAAAIVTEPPDVCT